MIIVLQALALCTCSVGLVTASSGGSTVTVQTSSGNVTITGVQDFEAGINSFYGVPYAAPPVGPLRLSKPEAYQWNTTTFSATQPAPACLQPYYADYTGNYGVSEDCLILDCYTPLNSSLLPGRGLPVIVWIHGGTYAVGSASTYPGEYIMRRGLETNRPFIFVVIQYRLGIFGFPGGQDVAAANVANLGLRDVMLALDWVQDNIQAFGGDPERVTVAGQSAGAFLVSLLYLQEDITTFRAAIMESGSQSVSPMVPTDVHWQDAYEQVLNMTGCYERGNKTTRYTSLPPSLSCLRDVSGKDLLEAQVAVELKARYFEANVFSPSIDGALIPASPHALLAEGKFAKKPFISGDVLDEGTSFVPVALANSTDAGMVSLINGWHPVTTSNATEVISTMLSFYPEDPSAGSPFDTGNNTFGLPTNYKRFSAFLGDLTFTSARRWFMSAANNYGLVALWGYQFARDPPGAPPALGVAHAFELAYVFGIPEAERLGFHPDAGLAVNTFNLTYGDSDLELSRNIMDYWLNFAYFMDPNGDNATNLTYWPAYQSAKNLLFLNVSNITLVTDDFRQDPINFALANPATFDY